MRYLALLLLLVPGLATAQVYKCVDKEGRVKYVQTKPRDGNCSDSVPTAPAPASDGADPLKGFSEEVGKSRDADAKAREQAAQQQAQRAARCAQWRQRLAALERASKVFTVDEQGERHYRSDAENEQQREQARQGVATDCS
ncbi:MAG: DUF4124 domain-containing protein [Nevskiaceae bacterium]